VLATIEAHYLYCAGPVVHTPQAEWRTREGDFASAAAKLRDTGT
jgi:hypothetical protein